MRAFLITAEAVILGEIADKALTRRSVAMTYRLAIEAERGNGEVIDWGKVNRAILARWTRTGLEWIKTQAHNGKCFADVEAGVREQLP